MPSAEETDDPHEIIREMRDAMVREADGDGRAARFLKWASGVMVLGVLLAGLIVWHVQR